MACKTICAYWEKMLVPQTPSARYLVLNIACPCTSFFFARGGRAGWSCEGERKANAGTSPLVGLGGWFSRQNSGTICCGIALAGFLGVEVTKKLIHSSSYISESHQTTNIADSQIALPAHPKQPSTLKSYKMI
jgi:hypothetical protein